MNDSKFTHSIERTGCVLIYWDGIPFDSDVTYVSENIVAYDITLNEARARDFFKKHLLGEDAYLCEASRTSMINGECDEYEIEYLYHTCTGREKWICERTSLQRDENGAIYGETILKDVSELKAQEKIVEGYSKKFRKAAEETINKINYDSVAFKLGSVMNFKELQMFQDILSEAKGIYMVCYDNEINRITKLSCEKDDKIFVNVLGGRTKVYDDFDDVAKAVITGNRVVKKPGVREWIGIVGIPLFYGNEVQGVIVFGYVDRECHKDSEAYQLGRKISRTSVEDIIFLIDRLVRKFMEASYSTALAIEAVKKSDVAVQNMEEQVRRNNAITSIVQLLEADQNFEEAVKIVLGIVGDYLDIDNALLEKKCENSNGFERVTEWNKEGVRPVSQEVMESYITTNIKNEGELLVVSSSERVEGLGAVVAIPIFVNNKVSMYACFCDKTKERIWLSTTVRFLSDVSKMIQSILYKRIAKNSLVSSYTALKEILDNIGSEICVIDKDTKEILFCNDVIKKVCKMDMLGKKCSDYYVACQHKDCETCPMVSQKEHFFEEYNLQRSAWYEVKHNDITWVDGHVVSLSIVTDVTEKKKYQKRIEFQANNDFLTGLYNRMRCEEDLERCIRMTEMMHGKGALLFMDLDNFKNINDGLGHQYGDVLLKTISIGIQQIKGLEDKCYRVGGDEFIMIVESEYMNEIDRILEDLKIMFSKPWYLNNSEYYCTMSMGIVIFPDNGNDVNNLIRKADIAMYEAKKSGKNRYQYYNRGEDANAIEALDVEKNMRSAVAIGCNEFEVYIQPIVDAKTEECIGGEALIRWNSGKLGLLTPGEFIPLAEHLGLITPIGEYVLRQVCMTNKRWSDMGIDFHINVNLSVVQLLQNNVVETIENAINMSGVNPDNLVLEMTESLAVNDMNRMKKIIDKIKALGIKIALDDFGTGYSSLNYIKQMDLDIIKVDRTFIKDIQEDDYAQAFVKLISDLSEKLNAKVCVEGVEEEEQLKILKNMNVSMIQGYYFGKPMPICEFEKKYIFKEDQYSEY